METLIEYAQKNKGVVFFDFGFGKSGVHAGIQVGKRFACGHITDPITDKMAHALIEKLESSDEKPVGSFSHHDLTSA